MQKLNNHLQRDYEGLIPTIKILSLAAQFISGTTGAFGIFVVVLEKLPIEIKVLAIAITITLTLIIIGAFEGGIRKLYPYWIRQILNWCFDTREEDSKPKRIRVLLFVMICVMLVPLVLGTTISSWKASPDLVSLNTPLPQLQDLGVVSEQLDSSSLQIIQSIDTEMERKESLFHEQVDTENERWQAKMKEQEVKQRHYLKLAEEGYQWANGSAYHIKTNALPSLKSKQKTALHTLQQSKVAAIDSLQTLKRSILLQAQTNKSTILESAQTVNDLNIQSRKTNIQKWGDFLAVLAIISTFFTLFCLSFIEAYKAGVLSNVSKIMDFTLNENEDTQAYQHNITMPKRMHVTPSVSSNSSKTQVVTSNTHNLSIVSIDKIIKRTRMQWQRSLDTNKTLVSRENNRQKAESNIAFLESLGIRIEVDGADKSRLVVDKREIL